MPANSMKAALLLLLLQSPALMAGKVSVIVNKQVATDSVAAADIRQIYMAKKTTLSSGEEVIPLDGVEGSPGYQAFYEQIMRKSTVQINSYWSRMMFTGRGKPPRQLSDSNDILQLVENNKNYMAYVYGEVKSDKVKVVYTIDVP